MTNNWKNIAPVFGWCMSLFPLDVRGEMSDYEVVCAITNRINQLIKNNEVLPDFITELIKEYVTEGELSKVLSDLLGEFMLNAKFPPAGLEPAVGDGSENDTTAIQGIIDYAANKGGGALFLPSGKYLVNNLTLRENVSIIGQDRYSTELVLTGGASDSLVKSTENNVAIQNVTLNGNAGIQVNELTLVSLNCDNVLIDNVIIKNAYSGVSFNGGGHLQISNTIFQNAVTWLLQLRGTALVQIVSCEFIEISELSGVYALFIGTSGGTFDFISKVKGYTACSIDGNNNIINATITNVTKPISDGGLRNSYRINGTEEKKYLTGDFDETVNGAYTSHVNGARTVNVGGNETKVVMGTTGFRSNGVYTEEYNSGHTVNAENQVDTENVGRKVFNAQDIVLNPTNPLTYKKPISLNKYFDYVNFKDSENNAYKILVENAFTNELGKSTILDIKTFGLVGDGVTDDSEKFVEAINSGYNLYIPNGTYVLANVGTIKLPNLIVSSDCELVFGENAKLLYENCLIYGVTFKTKTMGNTSFIEFSDKLSDRLAIINCNFENTITENYNGVAIRAVSNNLLFSNLSFKNYGSAIYSLYYQTIYNFKGASYESIRGINCCTLIGVESNKNYILDGIFVDSIELINDYNFKTAYTGAVNGRDALLIGYAKNVKCNNIVSENAIERTIYINNTSDIIISGVKCSGSQCLRLNGAEDNTMKNVSVENVFCKNILDGYVIKVYFITSLTINNVYYEDTSNSPQNDILIDIISPSSNINISNVTVKRCGRSVLSLTHNTGKIEKVSLSDFTVFEPCLYTTYPCFRMIENTPQTEVWLTFLNLNNIVVNPNYSWYVNGSLSFLFDLVRCNYANFNNITFKGTNQTSGILNIGDGCSNISCKNMTQITSDINGYVDGNFNVYSVINGINLSATRLSLFEGGFINNKVHGISNMAIYIATSETIVPAGRSCHIEIEGMTASAKYFYNGSTATAIGTPIGCSMNGNILSVTTSGIYKITITI